MTERIIFGGPSEIYEDDNQYHPSFVQLGYGEHAEHNEDYYAYAGLGAGVAFAQEMPEEAQVGLTYNAFEDMREAWDRDGVGAIRQAGAMGSLWVEGALRRESEDEHEDDGIDEADVRSQIFIGSSLKQRRREAHDVVLEDSLEDDLVDDDDELPHHRRDYRCAELGLLSEHRYANRWDENGNDEDGDEDEDGGRIYVVDGDGEHLAPCGCDDEYGCRDICERVGAYDLEDEFDGDE